MAFRGKHRVLSWLGRSRSRRETAAELYGAVVTAARQSWFYETCGVPDTPEGRFEMVALHLALLLRRLAQGDREARLLARALGEAFVTDMDDCMREMGVGDLSVPRKVKTAAGALAERTRRYGTALDGTNGGIAQSFSEILPGLERAGDLADYVRRSALHLDALSHESLFTRSVSFPRPEGGPSGEEGRETGE